MLHRTSLGAALILALSASAALASPGAGPRFPASYDQDGNGRVTLAEIQAARTAEFTAIDTDNDGYASPAEAKAWLATRQTSDYTALDKDASGSVSQAEFVGSATGQALKGAKEAFALADTSGDSALSQDEFSALHPVLPEAVHLFLDLDADYDLQVSEDEYLTLPGPGGHGGPGPKPRR